MIGYRARGTRMFFLTLFAAALCACSAAFSNNIPRKPANVQVPPAATTYSSVSIIWDKPPHDESVTGYRVYIDGELLGETAPNETYYTIDGLMPDTEYVLAVSALSGKNESERSDEARARTDKKGIVRDITGPPYHARGDGRTLCTEAIQKAIDDCNANDIVLIPEGGVFLTGALDLKSNMTLEVNGTILGSKYAEDYEKANLNDDSPLSGAENIRGGTSEGAVYTGDAPKRLIWSRIEGWEQYSYRSLINIGFLSEDVEYAVEKGHVCSNVKICGTGTITGDGEREYCTQTKGDATHLARDESEMADAFYDMANSEADESDIRRRIRGRLINVSNATDIYVKGITIANPPCWSMHMVYSDRVTTSGCSFESRGCQNGDGWDPDSSTNCTIFDCDFDTGDDCIAIKSGKNPEGNVINRPSKNIRIIGCRSTGGNGIAAGSEMSGGIDGVQVRDCSFSNTWYGIELKANEDRGGYIMNIDVSDSTIDQILVHSVTYNADGVSAGRKPVFKDMRFENLNVVGCAGGSTWLDTSIQISGFEPDAGDDYYVANIGFEDIVLGTDGNALQNVSLDHCREITFDNVRQADGGEPGYNAVNAEYSVNGRKFSQ